MRRHLTLAALAALVMLVGCPGSDTEAPTVEIKSPSGTVNRGDIVIKAVATDNKAVTKVEFHVAGALKGTDNVGGAGDTFRYTWSDTAAQVPGQSYALSAKAYDAAENSATSATVTITIAGGGGGTGPTNHNADIVGGDSVWYASGNPHIVTRGLNIADNGKLTIMPGCVVKFATGAGFTVGNNTPGELFAVGKADSMIQFTSNATTPNPGDWYGFDFFGQTRISTRLSYCDINYGGFADYGAISLDWGGAIQMDHTTIRNAPKYGVWAGDFNGYIAGFTGNTITACGSYPVRMGAPNLSKLQGGNTLTGNAASGIYVTGGDVKETGTWLNQGVPYVLGYDLNVGGDDGPVLTIQPGTTLKFTSGTHFALGYTVPAGVIADSVTFTSAASTPQHGDWEGIWFYGAVLDVQCRLTRCNIGYGGATYGNVWVEDAVPTITGCSIHDSKTWGIELTGLEYPDPDSLLANNTFANNDSGDVKRP